VSFGPRGDPGACRGTAPGIIRGGLRREVQLRLSGVVAREPEPPDLAAAPKGPYLKDRMTGSTASSSPANDEIGYILPGYDFKDQHDAADAPVRRAIITRSRIRWAKRPR